MARLARREFLRLGLGAALGATLGGQKPVLMHARTPNLVPNVGRGAPIFFVDTKARYVSLTFDDLWYEDIAYRIGLAYARQGIRLTFFPIGRAVQKNLKRPDEGYENLYPQLRDMGHEIGCHLYTHESIRGYSLEQLIDEEMERTLDVLQRALGRDFYPVALRPPFGIITKELRQLSRMYDIPLVLWNVDTQDAICSSKHEPEECESEVLNNIRNSVKPGSIVLQHTIQVSLLAIQPILDLLDSSGLKPISLTSLLSLPDYPQYPQQNNGLLP